MLAEYRRQLDSEVRQLHSLIPDFSALYPVCWGLIAREMAMHQQCQQQQQQQQQDNEKLEKDYVMESAVETHNDFPEAEKNLKRSDNSSPSHVIINERHMIVYIPAADEHPEFNFVGRIVGPRGTTLKRMEEASGCRIQIRGKGSVRIRDGTVGGRDSSLIRKRYMLDQPLHVSVQVDDDHISDEECRKRLEMCRKLIEPLLLIVPTPSHGSSSSSGSSSVDEIKRRQMLELNLIQKHENRQRKRRESKKRKYSGDFHIDLGEKNSSGPQSETGIFHHYQMQSTTPMSHLPSTLSQYSHTQFGSVTIPYPLQQPQQQQQQQQQQQYQVGPSYHQLHTNQSWHSSHQYNPHH